MLTFKQRLIDAIETKRKKYSSIRAIDVKGCDEEAIQDVMKTQGVDFLPEIYKDFLRVLGKSPGGWYVGSDITVEYIKYAKDGFKEDAEYNEQWSDAYEDVFVFIEHQAYVYYFFHTADREPNPSVFVFGSGKTNSQRVKTCGDYKLDEFLIHEKDC